MHEKSYCVMCSEPTGDGNQAYFTVEVGSFPHDIHMYCMSSDLERFIEATGLIVRYFDVA